MGWRPGLELRGCLNPRGVLMFGGSVCCDCRQYILLSTAGGIPVGLGRSPLGTCQSPWVTCLAQSLTPCPWSVPLAIAVAAATECVWLDSSWTKLVSVCPPVCLLPNASLCSETVYLLFSKYCPGPVALPYETLCSWCCLHQGGEEWVLIPEVLMSFIHALLMFYLKWNLENIILT